MKKLGARRIALHRETLRSLQQETLTGAVGGVTVANSCTVTICGNTCNHTACHTCLC